MNLGKIFGGVFAIFAILLMFFYLVPFGKINFTAAPGNSNFSIIGGNESMQFYPNMRFPNTEITYTIFNCPLQKENEMEYAFNIIENLTQLKFYSANSEGEISVTCQETEKLSGSDGFFIAGEGGPTNITIAGNFAIIMGGQILLIRDSNCPTPNIAIHELLHVLGFQHSTNPQNIMYNITSCDQTIGEDTIQTINELYSIPSYPDLAFENVSALMNGRFLNIDMTISNEGLNDSGASHLEIYADGNLVKELDLEPIKIRYNTFIHLENIWIPQINVKEIEMSINSTFNELTKENNKIKLEINKD